jgi:formate C-acetyltransferase
MWPGFYSHMVHVHSGRNTMATPDGRCRGDALSENQSPSYGSPVRSPLAVLRTMASLPLEHTTSGAFMLSLPGSDWSGPEGVDRLQVLLEAYFGMGGLHLHVNTTDVATLRAALKAPDQHRDLMVRVAGFSAYFTQLTPEVQLDVVQRYENAPQG